MVRTKICCISSVAEAELAISAGAAAIGLVAEMPSGPGVIGDALIEAIAAAVRGRVETFLLTSRSDARGIIDHALACGTDTVQIVGAVAPAVRREIRRAVPALRIVQVVHVEDAEAVAAAVDAAAGADAILLDSGRPSAQVPELGGTGRTHDWAISAEVVRRCPAPVYLAGGLRADNVRDAIRAARPFGVDICSGVRRGGRLDPVWLANYMAMVEAA